MIFAKPSRISSRGLFFGMMFLLSVASSAAAPLTDLTIDVAGELLEQGGVVTIYHLPVGLEDRRANASDSTTTTVRIERRYAEIQLRYPENGTFSYRFRAVPGSPNAEKHRTQVLSVIGTDTEGRGPQMVNGFVDAYSSGGRVIRIPPMAEIAGEDEVTRSGRDGARPKASTLRLQQINAVRMPWLGSWSRPVCSVIRAASRSRFVNRLLANGRQ